MSLTDGIEQLQAIHREVQEVTGKGLRLQSKIETRSGVGDALRNYVNITYSHLAKLEKLLNTFVTINKLPSELLTHIILFAHRPRHETRHPYMLYTWVCRHWRSTLIQNANFWRVVRFESKSQLKNKKANLVFGELVRRSKSATLDVEITHRSIPLISMSETFFGLTNRIRKLRLLGCGVTFISSFAGQTFSFSSLKGVNCEGELDGFFALLPVLVGLEHLETLKYNLLEVPSPDKRKQLATVFSKIQNLHITILRSSATQSTLDLLHDNTKLQNLCLVFGDTETEHNNPIVLPELQFLTTNNLHGLKYLRTPKLSCLDTNCCPLTHAVLEDVDFSSIKYLFVTEQFMMGTKEAICSQSLFPIKHANVAKHFSAIQDCLSIDDFLSYSFPRDCFRFKFGSKKIFVQILFSILPRMKSLTNLHMLVDHKDHLALFTRVLTLVPSVEKIVARHNCRPRDYIKPLRNPSLCPRLRHLSLVGHKPHRPEDRTLNSIGQVLYQCFQSRQGECDNTLEYVTLEISRPLPDNWTNELQKLGMTVVVVE